MTRSARSRHTESDPHWFEWTTGFVCALMVLAMIGWMAREAWYYTGEPPELSAAILKVEPAGGNYRVSIDVRNSAASTAASVSVRGEILRDGAVIETSDVTFDYVPAKSFANGALLFRNDPAGGELRVLPMGYTKP